MRACKGGHGRYEGLGGDVSRVRRRVGWRADRRARHHHVWRSEFWLRPALLLLYGLLVAALALGLAWDIPDRRREAAVTEAGACHHPVTGPCLAEVEGWVDGPHYRRRGVDSWHFIERSAPERALDVFELPVTAHWTLLRQPDEQVVTALVYDGEVVAVRLPDGRQLNTDSFGAGRWWINVILVLLVLGGSAVLFEFAVGRRRVVGGWWGVSDVHRDRGRLGWFLATGAVLFGGGAAAILPMMVSGFVPWSAALAVLGGTAGLALARVIILDRDSTPTRLSRR
jgi:hypothetical protein